MFKLRLVTPTKKIVDELEVSEVFVPAYRGEIDILPGHAPLVTTLSTGILKYREKDAANLHSFAVSWGYCEVHADGVTILADTAEAPSEIDPARAKEAYSKAEKEIGTAAVSEATMTKYQNKLKRAEVRLAVSQLK